MRKLIWIILFLTACGKDNPPQSEADPDYIIFGHFYGECIGEQCIEIYKLTKGHLYEDTNDFYPNHSAYNGNFVLLTQALFDKVSAQPIDTPTQLLASPSGTVGAPDAADGGGIYFEVVVAGTKKFWFIDKVRSNLPEYLKPFVDQIEGKIALINS